MHLSYSFNTSSFLYLKKRGTRLLINSLLILMLSKTTMMAIAQPSNDICDNAIMLAVDGTCQTYSNVDATASNHPRALMQCGNNFEPAHDVWFSILELLHSLLEEEVFGKIEPLNEYTVHTIKAFCQFIENDFQSERQLEKIRKHDGSYSEKFRRLNENSNIVEKLNRLKNELVSQDKMFENLILGPSLASVRHPELYILINGVKIGINAGYSTRDKISFGYTINRNDPDSMQKLSSLVEKLGIKLKKQNDKYYAYCRTEEMKKTIKLNNPSKIEAKLKKVIQYTE